MRKFFPAALPVILPAGGALSLYLAYKRAFLNPPPHREDPYKLPRSEQYQRNREEMLSLIREFDRIPYEKVYITSYDGLRLFGRYYHVKDGAPLQIQFHGYRGTAMRDFCGGNKLAREAGLNTLVVDQRAHGQSQGSAITMGIRERQDCLSWARYAADRFGPETPITLAGVSMGAATVLMASDLENVRGSMADCPYASPEGIIQDVLGKMKLPPRLFYPLLSLAARIYGDFRLESASALESVRRTRLPILLIHGEEDCFVPCGMSRELAAAGGDKVTLATFPGAGHGLSFIEDRARYAALVSDFLAKVL